MSCRLRLVAVAMAAMLVLTGCEAAAALFEAGWWLGLVVAAVVVGVVAIVVSRMRR